MTRPSFGYVVGGVGSSVAVEHGVLAEKFGFEKLWVPDHFVDVIDGDRLEPWTVLSAVAMVTKKIRLGSGVTDTQRNHPARTAHMVASADVISGGRVILGIGAGEAMNIVPFGLPWESAADRVGRLAETIKVIRALSTSSREKRIDFEGRYYRLKNAFLTQSPKQKPHPPIYVGAFSSKQALQVVGEFGDGWLPWLNTPTTFRRRWSIIQKTAESVGRSPSAIEPCVQLMVAFPNSSAEKRNALMAGKVNLIMEKSLLQELGKMPEIDQYQNLIAKPKNEAAKILNIAEKVPDDHVYRTMGIGSDDVREKVEDFTKVGVKHIAIVDLLSPKTIKRTLSLFRKIIRDHS